MTIRMQFFSKSTQILRPRILEEQNSLQMSQVFFGVAHSSFARFAFQGF
jgi:hypothetical protein